MTTDFGQRISRLINFCDELLKENDNLQRINKQIEQNNQELNSLLQEVTQRYKVLQDKKRLQTKRTGGLPLSERRQSYLQAIPTKVRSEQPRRFTKKDLVEIAQQLGLVGVSRLTKSELCKTLNHQKSSMNDVQRNRFDSICQTVAS